MSEGMATGLVYLACLIFVYAISALAKFSFADVGVLLTLLIACSAYVNSAVNRAFFLIKTKKSTQREVGPDAKN